MQNFNMSVSKVNEFSEYLNETSGSAYMRVVRDLIRFDPFEGNKFYIFSFMKLKDRERFHQPRLTRPDPIPGGTLIKVDPRNPDKMTLCWTLPPEESFGLYKYKKAFADQFVFECINTYKKNPGQLSKPDADDLSDDACRELYKGLKARVDKVKNAEKANSSFAAV